MPPGPGGRASPRALRYGIGIKAGAAGATVTTSPDRGDVAARLRILVQDDVMQAVAGHGGTLLRSPSPGHDPRTCGGPPESRADLGHKAVYAAVRGLTYDLLQSRAVARDRVRV